MAKTIDLRTYLLLERAFVRRLQRSWRQRSAPIYQKITQACLDHKWDEARRLVPDLDMAEVGTENREWITYMLLSCAVFGAGIASKKKPSFVGVGTFDTFLKQVTSNFLQYLEFSATAQVQAEAMQSIAEDEAKTKALKWDNSQHPRDKEGRFVDAEGVTHVGDFVELYHGTSRLRANKILKEGFKIRAVAKQTMGGDPERNRDYVWLAKRMASAKSYSEMHARPAVVTVRLPKALYEKLTPYGRNTGPDSVWTREAIPAKYVHVEKWEEAQHPRDKEGQFTETVYHGTGKDFSTFDLARGGEATGAKNGVLGAFFTTDISKAGELYAGRRGTLMEARLALKNPARFKGLEYDNDASALVNSETAEYVEKPLDDLTEEDFLAWRDFLIRQGHDGIEVTLHHGEKDYIVFDAKQIHRLKWEEAKHPRDKEGQFTASGAAGGGRAEYPMEGGHGPARVRWEKLNEAAMAANDVLYDQVDATKAVIARLEKKHNGVWDEVFKDPEYIEAQAKREAAEKVRDHAYEVLKRQDPAMRREVVRNLATDVAEKMSVDPSIIDVVHQDPREFDVGNKHFTEAGHFNPVTGRVQVNAQTLPYGNAPVVKGVVAHELSHVMYHSLKKFADSEFRRYLDKAVTPDGQHHTAWYHERFGGQVGDVVIHSERKLKPEYQEEMAKEFPASTVMASLSGGELFSGISTKMVQENGHSEYAKSYWSKEAVQSHGNHYESAINETLAEVTRYLTSPSSWHAPDSPPHPTSPWVKLARSMHEWYADRQEQIKVERMRLAAQYNKTLKELEKRWAEEEAQA